MSDCLNRRSFLATSALALAGCATVPWHTAEVFGPSELALNRSLLTVEVPTVVLRSAQLEAPVVVATQADGSIRAFDLTCTHRACIVSVGRERLTCPCHGSQFTLAGEVTEGPAEHPLREYPLQERDGYLILEPGYHT